MTSCKECTFSNIPPLTTTKTRCFLKNTKTNKTTLNNKTLQTIQSHNKKQKTNHLSLYNPHLFTIKYSPYPNPSKLS